MRFGRGARAGVFFLLGRLEPRLVLLAVVDAERATVERRAVVEVLAVFVREPRVLVGLLGRQAEARQIQVCCRVLAAHKAAAHQLVPAVLAVLVLERDGVGLGGRAVAQVPEALGAAVDVGRLRTIEHPRLEVARADHDGRAAARVDGLGRRREHGRVVAPVGRGGPLGRGLLARGGAGACERERERRQPQGTEGDLHHVRALPRMAPGGNTRALALRGRLG